MGSEMCIRDSDNLPDPATLVAEIIEELEAALLEFNEIAESLTTPEES